MKNSSFFSIAFLFSCIPFFVHAGCRYANCDALDADLSTYIKKHALKRAEPLRVPEPVNPGLSFTSGAVALSQSDFDSGTYRITEPGYYYFAENVEFQPDPVAVAARGIKPDTGWFAGITVETDNVVIDLNTKTFEVSQDFLDTHSFKVFSLIELGNSPFPQNLAFTFTFVTEYVAAHNVVIRNGTLGRSSHHGIHGNDNTDVFINNMVIRDFEVAAVALNGPKGGAIQNLSVSGTEHRTPFNGLFAVLNASRVGLQRLIADGDSNAQPYLDALEIIISDTTKNGMNNSGLHDSNQYGIFINRIVDVGPLVDGCGDKSADGILIENVTVSNLHVKTVETVAIQDNNGTLLKGDLFGAMRWDSAYPDGPTFAPNALLKAQTYVVNANHPDNLPAGFAANILSDTPDEATFLSQVQPSFNHDFAGHTTKGLFGIRLDCGHGIIVRNCNIVNLENDGDQGLTLSEIASGTHYSDSYTETRYKGNDVYGISLAGCHGCKLENNSIFECKSDNGYVHGIGVQNYANVNIISNCESSDHSAQLDNPGSIVNPSSEVYGLFLYNNSDSNRILNTCVQALTTPRYSYGFYTSECRNTLFDGCSTSGSSVSSSSNLDKEKAVIGFVSIANQCTLFRNCDVHNIIVDGEDEATSASASITAGFMLKSENGTNDKQAEIINSKAISNNGGAGIAAGVLMNGSDGATILQNVLRHNYTNTAVGGKGYGILDQGNDSAALILQNIASNNSNANYSVHFSSAHNAPITEGYSMPVTNNLFNMSF